MVDASAAGRSQRPGAMSRFFPDRLGARLLSALGLALAGASLASLALFVPLYRHELKSEREAVSTRLGAFLQIALENAMLKRDIPGLIEIVSRLGGVENVIGVSILNPALETRFSSDAAKVGEKHVDLAALCAGCAVNAGRGGIFAAFLRAADGREYLRSVNAVANREACKGCHGEASVHPVNGFVVIDYEADSLRARAWRTALLLSGAGFLVMAATLLATWLALRGAVLKPVARLTRASARLASGDLDARAGVADAPPDEIGRLAATFDDMAGRLKATMTALKERERFQQGLIDATPDAVRVVADDYSVVAANREFCRQMGLDHARALSSPCYASSHGRTEPCVPTLAVCPLETLRDSDETVKCMHIHKRADGSEFAVEVIAAPLTVETAAGPRRYVVEAIRDLSQEMQISQDQRLSEIGQLATGVAHEIHNPLASIRLGLSALRRIVDVPQRMEETQAYLDLVDTEVERCIDVTGRLMKLSQTSGERGALVDLARIARDAASLLNYEARTRGVTLDVRVEDCARIVAHDGEVGMVFINLIQNAFHATGPGGRVDVRQVAGAPGEIAVEVADTGVGIGPENLKKIFHPFWSWRADGSSGSGLGLAICKAVMTKWGGAIGVRSVVGGGTTFTLTFPDADRPHFDPTADA